jgi:hypothetical protein
MAKLAAAKTHKKNSNLSTCEKRRIPSKQLLQCKKNKFSPGSRLITGRRGGLQRRNFLHGEPREAPQMAEDTLHGVALAVKEVVDLVCERDVIDDPLIKGPLSLT